MKGRPIPNTEERLRALRTALAQVPADSPAALAYEAAIKRVLAETRQGGTC